MNPSSTAPINAPTIEPIATKTPTPIVTEIARQLASEFQPRAGSVAGANDRDHWPYQDVGRAAHTEQGRRILERCQPRRIGGFAGRDQHDADPFRRSDFSPRFLLAADPP